MVAPGNGSAVLKSSPFVDVVRDVVSNVSAIMCPSSQSCCSTYPYDDIATLSACLSNASFSSSCPLLRYSWGLYASFLPKKSAAALISVTPVFDPDGPLGNPASDNLLAYLRRVNVTQTSGVALYVSGSGWDAVDYAYSYFFVMVVVTVGAILLFVGIAFLSVVVPLRSILTIGLTVLFVFGFASLVYVKGVLAWTTWYFFSLQNAILWLPPIVSFSIVTGLCLDYDMFLLVRVQEFRRKGYSTLEAVPIALYKTGGVITSAGIIMSIAFSSLLFSPTPALNQLSFYLVFSVLYDTFVIRIFLVPALFSILPEWTWWPGSLRKTFPPISKKVEFDWPKDPTVKMYPEIEEGSIEIAESE